MSLSARRTVGRVTRPLIAFFAGCICFLLIGEVWTYLPDPRLREHKNSLSASPYYVMGKCGVFVEKGEKVYYTYGYRVDNNSLGFRDREVDIPKPANVFRVVVVGDSASWGTGLPLEKRYTNLAEAQLNRELKQKEINMKVEVLTFATGGGYMGQYLTYIKKHQATVVPDLVVVALVFNDMNKNGTDDEGTRKRYQQQVIPKWTTTLNCIDYLKSGLLRRKLSPKGMFMLLEEIGIIPDVYEAIWISGYDKTKPNWQQFVKDMTFMHELCLDLTGRDPVLLYLMVPVSNQRTADYSTPGRFESMERKMFNSIKPLAEDLGYVQIDMFTSFKRELDGKYIALNTNDAHPNELCHRVYARKLTKCVLEHVDFESLSKETEKGNDE